MPSYSIQFRRGTATDHSSFTGEFAEITVDITNNRIILHDGETPGGIPIAKLSDVPVDVGDLSDDLTHIAAANAPAAGTYLGDRGVFAGGSASTGPQLIIEYIDITSLGDASVFGDLTENKSTTAACSNGSRGVFIGGANASSTRVTDIEYITIASPGNATGFGDITTGTQAGSGISDGTYGLIAGGIQTGGSPFIRTDTIEYFTISTPDNASDFGNLTVGRFATATCSDGTYGIIAGGNDGSSTIEIDYITTATPGHAAGFGNLTALTFWSSGVSDATYGVIGSLYSSTDGSGNHVGSGIDYMTIATTGSATDFGDFTTGSTNMGGTGASNGSRGLFHVADAFGGPAYRTNIEYVTIASPGNAAGFGNLTVGSRQTSGLAGSPS